MNQIYLILYSRIARDEPCGCIGGLYFGWAPNREAANRIFQECELTAECFRKEIWVDDGRGYRRLLYSEKYRPKEIRKDDKNE